MKRMFLVDLVLYLTLLYTRVCADCKGPLGMESGYIKNDQITSEYWLYSTIATNRHYAPHLARLNVNSTSGGWCSEDTTRVKNQFIEIDLLQNKRITGIATQGRFKSSEYVEAFKVSYQRDYESNFRKFLDSANNWKVFKGNWDSVTVMKMKFIRSIIARRIRIYPVGNEFTISCMRLELYGCSWSQAKAGLVSYLSPAGSIYNSIDMRDTTYDGEIDSNSIYSKGIGKLTDDVYGSEKLSVNNISPWIAYTEDQPVITFHFHKRRLFKQIIIHVNKIEKTEDLFERVEILKSEYKENFTHVKYHIPSRDEYFEKKGPFAVVISVNQIFAKSIRLVFTKTSRWLFISEITFLPKDQFVTIFTSSYPKTAVLKPTKSIFDIAISEKMENEKEASDNDKKGDSNVKQLSFPIILTITLVTIIAAVLVIIFILRTYKKKQKGKNDEHVKCGKSKHSEDNENVQKLLPTQQLQQPQKIHTNSLLYDENARVAFHFNPQKHSQNNVYVNPPLIQEGTYIYPVPQQQAFNNEPRYEYVR